MPLSSAMAKALAKYTAKRNFDSTAEPPARVHRKRKGEALSFVVQKHAARRLHYDFRLELDGVLKSWAVPKGPSLSPHEKRLAVEVEDHPFDYRNFEGTIPEGGYGGGEVIVWDRGTWVPEGDAHAALKKGHLTFHLDGEKLKGTFSLIRIRSREGDQKTNWLLMKGADEFARDKGDITQSKPKSVLSGGTVEARTPKLAQKTPPAKAASSGSTKALAALLADVKPELATLVDAPPKGDDWIFETKFDGYRAIAIVQDGDVRILSRSGLDWTARFPSIAAALAKRNVKNAVFDGEICVVDDQGHTSFQRLQEALSQKDDSSMAYFIFDVLVLDGDDLRAWPLLKRKEKLAPIMKRPSPVLVDSPYVRGNGERAFASACRAGLEGVIAKRAESAYSAGRTRDWLKVKCEQRQEFVIVGYTAPKGGREGLGALVLGVKEDGALRVVGKVGTGFSNEVLVDLYKRLAPSKRDTPPANAPARLRGVTWVEPRLVCEVRFTEWTRDGAIRHPAFLGLREDKRPQEVTRERRETVSKAAHSKTTKSNAHKPKDRLVLRGVEITHPDRVVDSASGATKGDIARYYDSIADALLPFVTNRPLALVRCPNGDQGKCFFQKHHKPGMGKDILHDTVMSEGTGRSEGKSEDVLFVKTAVGLLQLVQFGVIEIHGWGSRFPRPENPDWIVMDLDPDEGLPFARVVDAAREMRDALKTIGLTSWVKTTGGKGLHVVVPIAPKQSWDTVKGLAREIARQFAIRAPDRYVDTASKEARRGKIFVDYLRNGSGATAVVPLSVRARKHATVAMPVTWEELGKIDPQAFTIATASKRKAIVDAWSKALLASKQALAAPKGKRATAAASHDQHA